MCYIFTNRRITFKKIVCGDHAKEMWLGEIMQGDIWHEKIWQGRFFKRKILGNMWIGE